MKYRDIAARAVEAQAARRRPRGAEKTAGVCGTTAQWRELIWCVCLGALKTKLRLIARKVKEIGNSSAAPSSDRGSLLAPCAP